MDRNVGRLLDAIDALPLSSRTIVIFTSDHGYNIGQHGIHHKGNARWIVEGKRGRRPNMYDTSIRVPMAVRWPGTVKPDTVIDRTVSHLDLYPSILAMAGVKLPPDVKIHGRDFTPLLRGHEPRWDDTLFGQYDIHHGIEARMRMIRTPAWKLVRHYGASTPPDELYHLAADPDERINLIDVPAHRRRGADLRARLLEWQKSIDDPLLTRAE